MLPSSDRVDSGIANPAMLDMRAALAPWDKYASKVSNLSLRPVMRSANRSRFCRPNKKAL